MHGNEAVDLMSHIHEWKDAECVGVPLAAIAV